MKFIFPEEKLSVQVHPDDDYAARHEQAAGGRGKTEMWYALRARPGAQVFVGLKPDITPEIFKRAIADGSADDCLQSIPISAGDAVFVPAGTAHTIGPGLVLCEIQEHSDLTYRVYDYNRRDSNGQPRELHVDKAFDVIRFGKQFRGKIEPVHDRESQVEKAFLASCRYFETSRWRFSGAVQLDSSRERFELLIFLEGIGTIQWGGERAAYGPAQVWMIPAGLGAYRVAPDAPTSLLRTYVPREPGEFCREPSLLGLSESQRSRLVYR